MVVSMMGMMGSLLNKSNETIDTGSKPVENKQSPQQTIPEKMTSNIKNKSEGNLESVPPKKKIRLSGRDRELYELTWSPVLGPSDLSGVISRSRSRSLRPLKSRPLHTMASPPPVKVKETREDKPDALDLTPDAAAAEICTGSSLQSSPTASHEASSNGNQSGFEEQMDISIPSEEKDVECEPSIQESSATAADPLEPELSDYDSDDEPDSPTVIFEDSDEEFDLDDDDEDDESVQEVQDEEIEVLDIISGSDESDDSEDENVTDAEGTPQPPIPTRVPSIIISLERS